MLHRSGHMQMIEQSVLHRGGGNFEVEGQPFVVTVALQDARGLHHAVLNVHGQRAATFDYMDGQWYVGFNHSLQGSRYGGVLSADGAAALYDAWRAYGFPTER